MKDTIHFAGFLLSLLLLTQTGCGSSKVARHHPIDKESQEKPEVESETTFGRATAPVDPSDLEIVSLSVTKQSERFASLPRVQLEATGTADYVKYKVCGLEDRRCKNGKKNVNSFVLIPRSNGMQQIGVKACVSSRNSTDGRQGCGKEKFVQFAFKDDSRGQLQELNQQRDLLTEEMNQLAAEAGQVLQVTAEALEDCQTENEKAQKVAAWKAILSGVAVIGSELLDRAFLKGSEDRDLLTGKKAKKKVTLESKDGELIKKTTRTDSALKTFSNHSGSLGGLGKVTSNITENLSRNGISVGGSANAVAMLGGALFDLFTGDAVYTPQCIAETEAKTRIASIKTLLEQARSKLSTVNSEIKDLRRRR